MIYKILKRKQFGAQYSGSLAGGLIRSRSAEYQYHNTNTPPTEFSTLHA